MRALLLALLAMPLAAAAPPPVGFAASDPRSFTWVEEGVLAVGGGGLTREQVDWLHGQGFAAIADFRAEHEDPAEHIRAKGMAFLDMPVEHAVEMNATQLETFVAWAKEQEAAGRTIYIHCTNGWHRAAAFAVAWQMERERRSFDDVADEAEKRRPGTVMRAPAALLAYEARLTGREQLAVVILSNATRPENASEMPMTVEVRARGVPVEGAKVKVWSEESRLGYYGKTDAEGRYAFTYRAPTNHTMDHLYARASHEGFLDGADNVELFYMLHRSEREPPQVEATRTEDGGLAVRVLREGRPFAARVTVIGDGWAAHDWSAEGAVSFADVPEGALTLRANVWGAPTVTHTVEAIPPRPVAEPAPTPEPEPHFPPIATPPAPDPAPPVPAPTSPQRSRPLWVAGAAAVVVALALAYGAFAVARRAGVGRR